jgi:hypothetical protein
MGPRATDRDARADTANDLHTVRRLRALRGGRAQDNRCAADETED